MCRILLFLILFPFLSEAQLVKDWPKEPGVHRVDSIWIQPLNTYRAVWVYLPPDYNFDHPRERNLLIMQDGQNLFDSAHSFAGEWHVDEHLDSLFSQGFDSPIVVAPENGGAARIDEYSMQNGKYGGGKADRYAEFLMVHLIQEVEETYQLNQKFKTKWLMGSSLGASFSAYLFLMNPKEFSTLISFSPAYWYTPNILLMNYEKPTRKGIVFHIAGAKEDSGKVEGEIQKFELMLRADDGLAFAHMIHEDGEHNEEYWSREFYNTMRWLLPKKNKKTLNVHSNNEDEYFITIYDQNKRKKSWGIASNKKIVKRIEKALPKSNSLKREKVFIGY